MAMLARFDLSSGFTLFFLAFTVLLILTGVLLTRIAPKRGRGGGGGGRRKFDDTIVDRNRELID